MPLVEAAAGKPEAACGYAGRALDRTNADHFAAYRLDPHRFPCDLSGTTTHRDAQIRHALTRLINWAKQAGVTVIGIEDLDFTTEKTREKHGRRKRFRQLISGIPTAGSRPGWSPWPPNRA